MTEKANASGNALDMLTSVGSAMAREQVEPHMNRRKQMTTDSRRLMRPGVDAPRSTTSAAACPYCQAARWSDSGSLHPLKEAALCGLEPYEGKLSRTVLRGVRAGNRLHLPDSGLGGAAAPPYREG